MCPPYHSPHPSALHSKAPLHDSTHQLWLPNSCCHRPPFLTNSLGRRHHAQRLGAVGGVAVHAGLRRKPNSPERQGWWMGNFCPHWMVCHEGDHLRSHSSECPFVSLHSVHLLISVCL